MSSYTLILPPNSALHPMGECLRERVCVLLAEVA